MLLRVTVLRSLDGQMIQVPNQAVYTSAIVNRSSYPQRKYVSTARIEEDVPLNGILSIALSELRRVRGIAGDPAARVALAPRADFGPALTATYWIDFHRVDVGGVRGEVDARLGHVAAGTTLDGGAAELAWRGRWSGPAPPKRVETSIRRKPAPPPRQTRVLKAAKVVKAGAARAVTAPAARKVAAKKK